jgi:hypothetical protein
VYHSKPNIQNEAEMEKVLEALATHRCVKLLTEKEEPGGWAGGVGWMLAGVCPIGCYIQQVRDEWAQSGTQCKLIGSSLRCFPGLVPSLWQPSSKQENIIIVEMRLLLAVGRFVRVTIVQVLLCADVTKEKVCFRHWVVKARPHKLKSPRIHIAHTAY